MNREELKKIYSNYDIDIDQAIKSALAVPISINCWQGDDVCGFELGTDLNGGIGVTGNYIGRARDIDELMRDIDEVLKYVPGKFKINLHAIYGDFPKDITRLEIKPKHFDKWIDFCKVRGLGIDFNATVFSHKMIDNNLSLAHPKQEIRDYWITHVLNCRKIANYIAKELNEPVLNNLWIPDGCKDIPANRLMYRKYLKSSLDKIYADKNESDLVYDSLESKVFGIGIESYTVGSHEFYMQYTVNKNILYLLDNGHFHPTEKIADKISSLLMYNDKLALHLTRAVRWDSDHVVILNDELQEIMDEIAKYNAYDKVFIGLDFFDASINRISAWVVGIRNVRKAILKSLLNAHELITKAGEELNYTKVLVLTEEMKTLPFYDVWNALCEQANVCGNASWYDLVKVYEETELKERK